MGGGTAHRCFSIPSLYFSLSPVLLLLASSNLDPSFHLASRSFSGHQMLRLWHSKFILPPLVIIQSTPPLYLFQHPCSMHPLNTIFSPERVHHLTQFLPLQYSLHVSFSI
ncbi:hypothetical protein CPB84DRAFT_1775544 [Gymnopilus junonius]|uniref:Uncharacterized protein n=1 Tax=Gymnopilus junonius TaxID=109634 RepID=A0A9P5TPA1_GYMJU|nr:hypothetical protein CPB84DRAFT_1775544 [Gymnopilus junonius]